MYRINEEISMKRRCGDGGSKASGGLFGSPESNGSSGAASNVVIVYE